MTIPWYTVKKAANLVGSSIAQDMSTDEIADEIMHMAANGHVQLGVTSRDSAPLGKFTVKHPPKFTDWAPEWYRQPFRLSEPSPPVVAIDTLCVPESELPRIKAITNGETSPPRDLTEVLVSNQRRGIQFVSAREVADLLKQRHNTGAQQRGHGPTEGQQGPTDSANLLRSALFAAGVAVGHEIAAQKGKEDAARSVKQQTQEQADAHWKPPPGNASVVDETLFDDGEPRLKAGTNNRAEVERWVAWAASSLVKDGEKSSELAARIVLLAERRQFQSERGPLTIGNVLKMLPAGITGKRGRRKGSQSRK